MVKELLLLGPTNSELWKNGIKLSELVESKEIFGWQNGASLYESYLEEKRKHPDDPTLAFSLDSNLEKLTRVEISTASQATEPEISPVYELIDEEFTTLLSNLEKEKAIAKELEERCKRLEDTNRKLKGENKEYNEEQDFLAFMNDE